MGIPSYYRQLLQDVPELVIKQHPSDALSWLFMDYNGLIYQCLQRADVLRRTANLISRQTV